MGFGAVSSSNAIQLQTTPSVVVQRRATHPRFIAATTASRAAHEREEIYDV